jgi:hypothetical protein
MNYHAENMSKHLYDLNLIDQLIKLTIKITL